MGFGSRSRRRSLATMTDSLQRRGAVAVIPRDERLLVIRRSELVVAPRAYCFPGGGIEAGESDEEALRRELWEELNVAILPIRRLWQNTTTRQVLLSWWLAELCDHEVPVPNPAEVESVHWLEISEIRDLPELLDSNHAFLDAHSRGEFTLR